MKQVICTILFFALFFVLHTLVSWLVPTLFYLWYVIWVAIGLFSLIVCKIFYDWLERQEKVYLPPNRRAKIFFTLVFVAATIFGIHYWNEYKEKPLEAILEKYSYPKEIVIGPDMDSKIKDTQTVNEMIDFLSQYKVKKTKSEAEHILSDPYELWWKNEKGLLGPAQVMIVIERNEIFINMDHYRVLNGPVDVERVKEFTSKE
ncbi:hypothetical protein [Ferdinandcohnia sp. Marseille-Q9671]